METSRKVQVAVLRKQAFIHFWLQKSGSRKNAFYIICRGGGGAAAVSAVASQREGRGFDPRQSKIIAREAEWKLCIGRRSRSERLFVWK